jgi:hypothetical protein
VSSDVGGWRQTLVATSGTYAVRTRQPGRGWRCSANAAQGYRDVVHTWTTWVVKDLYLAAMTVSYTWLDWECDEATTRVLDNLRVNGCTIFWHRKFRMGIRRRHSTRRSTATSRQRGNIPRLVINVRLPEVLCRAAAVGARGAVHTSILNPQFVILVEYIVLLINADAKVEGGRVGSLTPIISAGANATGAFTARCLLRRARGSRCWPARHAARVAGDNDAPGSGGGGVAREVDLQLAVAVAAVLKPEGLELVVSCGQAGGIRQHVAV